MKELSIKEKAKRYDEALERMKSWARGEHPECFTEAQKAAEFIFPEFAESEDERVRKALIKLVKKTGEGYENVIDGVSIENAIAWLEKQELLTKEKALKNSPFVEQKPAAWSEEDEKMIYGITIDIEELIEQNAYDETQLRKEIDWLKSLRHQNIHAYNPYKAVVESIAAMVEKYAPFDSNLQDFYDNVKVKCKDAKEYDSLFPQSQWKPSEAQMEALESATENCAYSEYQDCLRELLGQLKKLREE